MAYPGAGPSSGGLPGRDRGWIWLVAVMVVLLAAASAAGGWFFLSHRSHPATRVAAASAGAAHLRPVSAGPGATSAGGGGSAAQASASPAPSGKASSSPLSASPPPVGRAGLVAISPAASGQAAPHVAAFLSRYFQAINAKDYPAYRSMYDPASNPAQSEAGFLAGYRTTQDSAITLVRLVPSGDGGWLATVTFTSNQDPSASPTGASCNQWRVPYELAPAGATFVLEKVPPGYHAAYQSCPS